MVGTLANAMVSEEIEPGRYRFPGPLPEGRGVIFGGHLLAQLAIAAARADAGKAIKSAHGVFAKTVSPDEPEEVTTDVLNRGRVLSMVSSAVWQGGVERARAIVMLSAPERDLIRHQAPMPEVPGPDESPKWTNDPDEDVRMVHGIDRHDPEVVAPPKLWVWVRFPGGAPDALSAQGLVIHASARFLMGVHMLPHPGIGERMAHVEFSTGIIAHSVSFHNEPDPSQWLLVSMESTGVGNGRAYGVGQVHGHDGTLVASFTQEALMRPFPEGHSVAGREAKIL